MVWPEPSNTNTSKNHQQKLRTMNLTIEQYKLIAAIASILALIGGAVIGYRLWLDRREWCAPKVSDTAVNVAVLIFRDFLKLNQGARQEARAKNADQYGTGAQFAELITGLPVESAAASNSHRSGVKWDIEFNPSGHSFITIHVNDDKGDDNLAQDTASFLMWKLHVAGILHNVHVSVA